MFVGILLFLSIISLFFLLLPGVTTMMSLFFRKKEANSLPDSYQEADFGCIITAYKNLEITLPGVAALLRQSHERFTIYLVTDACEDVENYPVKDHRLVILNPEPSLNLKAKSIIYAMDRYVRPHDYTIVFDGDNLAHPDFLKELSKYVKRGDKAIQGQRTAKNLDTMYACADATGEFYKNYIERYGPYLIGSSSVISGSGMAVETEVYRAYLNSPEIQRGKHLWKKMLQEDKILQNFLIENGYRITYAWQAVLYDEKVTTSTQVETQRSRWLYSYFQNVPNSLRILWLGLKRFSWNDLYFGLITIAPPLFLQVFSALLLGVIWLLVDWKMSVLFVFALAVFSLNVLFTLYLSDAPAAIWKQLWGIPLFIWNQVKALLKMKDPNKNFKHTEHSRKVTIDELVDTNPEK